MICVSKEKPFLPGTFIINSIFLYFLLSGLIIATLSWPHPALALDRIPIDEALKKQIVEAKVQGMGSIAVLKVALTKKIPDDIIVVVPPGTYFEVQDKENEFNFQAYWSTDQVSFQLLKSVQSSLDVPVVKSVLNPGSAASDTQFVIVPPPSEKIPKLLDFMLKNGMSHEAKQIAAGILQNPNITRDEIDGMYYKSHSGFIFSTEEAVTADDPINVFIALKQTGMSPEPFKLYSEQVSLVHGLGSSTGTIREFALTELIRAGSLDKIFMDSKDYKGALLHFLKHPDKSVQYRAVLGLEHETGPEVIRSLLPLLTDDTPIYSFPSILWGQSTTRTLRDTIVDRLKGVRNTNENDLISLLENPDYKYRLAGIEIFDGSKEKKIINILNQLRDKDEYKQVREAAEKALNNSE